MTLACQAQPQISILTKENSTDGEFGDDVPEDISAKEFGKVDGANSSEGSIKRGPSNFEKCRESSKGEGEDGKDFGSKDFGKEEECKDDSMDGNQDQSTDDVANENNVEVAQASLETDVGSFENDDLGLMEEDNLVDMMMEEGSLEDGLMEEVNLEEDLDGGNPDGGNPGVGDPDGVNHEGNNLDEENEGSSSDNSNSSSPLLIMSPFNKAFNNTDANDEEVAKNYLAAGFSTKLDNDTKLQNTIDQNQSTKSVLELLEDLGTEQTNVKEFSNGSDIPQAKSRSDHNDGGSPARFQNMIKGCICAAILINVLL